MTAKLTPTQITILEAAADRVGGNLEPLPHTLRGGARAKVIEGLLTRGLVVSTGETCLLTEAGYAAVGRKHPTDALQNLERTPRTIRPGTKLAGLIDALRHPGGATVIQIMASTGWQAHTVRGAISGMIRKKLGLNVESSKGETGERVYRIA